MRSWSERWSGRGIVSRALQELEPSLGDSLGGFMGSTGYRARLGEVRTVATFGRLPSRAIVLIGLGEAKDLTAQEASSHGARPGRG